jgi:predicted nucleic acid-binding protein
VQNFFKIFEVLPFDEQAAHEYGKIAFENYGYNVVIDLN